MVLKGEAKRDYQREYMRQWRRRRASKPVTKRELAKAKARIAELQSKYDEMLARHRLAKRRKRQ